MGTEDWYTGARKVLEREQVGKATCKGKGEAAWRLLGEEKGSGETLVMCTLQEPAWRMMVHAVHDGMPMGKRKGQTSCDIWKWGTSINQQASLVPARNSGSHLIP